MRFHTTILAAGKTATGIEVPDDVVEALNAGKRPKVKVTINGYTYRSSVASMGGKFMVSVSAENRAATGVSGGDEVDVEIEVDTEPREVTVPADFAEALDREPDARSAFEALTYSNKQRHTLPIEAARTPETRQRRIDKSVATLRDGPA